MTGKKLKKELEYLGFDIYERNKNELYIVKNIDAKIYICGAITRGIGTKTNLYVYINGHRQKVGFSKNGELKRKIFNKLIFLLGNCDKKYVDIFFKKDNKFNKKLYIKNIENDLNIKVKYLKIKNNETIISYDSFNSNINIKKIFDYIYNYNKILNDMGIEVKNFEFKQ